MLGDRKEIFVAIFILFTMCESLFSHQPSLNTKKKLVNPDLHSFIHASIRLPTHYPSANHDNDNLFGVDKFGK